MFECCIHRNQLKRRPLHEAAAKGHDEIVSLLVKKGKAKMNVEDSYVSMP